ncbi:CocE/NonD family hydrolase [Rhodobacterales bacterium]|nr:CocE/NonD family hydrolase [Rhodobacterales bacterium]
MAPDMSSHRIQPPVLPVKGPERRDVRLRDGTNLVASVWRPDTAKSLPVLLMRQPYGREIASTVTLAHPSWYAARGYIVAVQDVRGAGDSEGDFEALANEAGDGAETLDWARGLEGSCGKVGTYGFSYQGTTQFLMLAGGGRPDAMAVSMASWNPLMDWSSEGGLFRAAMSTGWAAQMARLKAHRLGDDAALAALDARRPWTELFDFLIARPDLSHLSAWASGEISANPSAALSPPPVVPLFQTAGAADFLLRGALAADAAFRAVSPETTHLVFAPWGHIGWNRSSGAARLAAGAEFSVDRAQLAFFDHYLKGVGNAPPPFLAYDGGTDVWREEDPVRFFAAPSRQIRPMSDGLAATLLGDGRLVDVPGDGQDVLVHDPSRPAPHTGGSCGTPGGPVSLESHHDRADVACYTSTGLRQDTLLAGRAEADVSVSLDGDLSGLAASLSVVSPDGSARALATSVAAIEPDQGSEAGRSLCRFRFDGLYRTLHSGEALRLAVQAAPCPDFLPFPARRLPRAGARATALTLHHAASRLLLPLHDQGSANA